MITNGYKCNYITVLGKERRNGSLYYFCQCKCGNTKYFQDSVVRYGKVQDCGCHLYPLDVAKKEYIGKKFNFLTITDCYMSVYQSSNRIFAKCKCDCGQETSMTLTEVKNGHIKSCGCIQKFDFDRDYKNKVYNGITLIELVKDNKNTAKKIVKCKCHCGEIFNAPLIHLIKHKRYIIGCHKCNDGKYLKYNITQRSEMSDGDIRTVFYGIKDRCLTKNRKDAKWYFDKGVTICDEWMKDINSFIKWAKQNGYKKGLTIDRIDPNGNYCPENCRWVDMETQNNNQCNSVKYLCDGQYLSIAQISRKKNMNYRTLLARKNRGWDIERIISTPIKHPKK